MNRGFDVVVDFFLGEWWKGDKESAEHFDKAKNGKNIEWYDNFCWGLLLGLLSQRWKDVARVCSWVEVRIRPGFIHEELEGDEMVHLYKSIAAGLRPEPMPGVEKLEKKIVQTRHVRPKLLFEAWDAARRKDQAAFDGALVKSLKHFDSNYGRGPIAANWVAIHQSVVALAGRRQGVRIPELPPALEARLMTPESLGLPAK